MNEKWQKFQANIREIYSLNSASALLGWDQETFMPPRGGEGRAGAYAALSKIIQEKYCAEENGDLIAALSESSANSELDQWQSGTVREFKRIRDRYLKIPLSLTKELAETTSLSQQVWARARPKNDTASFNPLLKKMVELVKQQADCIGFQESPYDALLDIYEADTKTSQLKNVFEEIKKVTVPLLERIKATGITEKLDGGIPASATFPVPTQKIFNEMVVRDMTFNLDAGRLDESAHPFTEGIWPGDVRLTTRYDEKDFKGGLFSSIHEAGHGLYEQGFLPEHYGTPMAEAVSLGIHESQSRLWENQVARSRGFWQGYFTKLRSAFPKELKNSNPEVLYRSINRVVPGYIRVDADELTYNMHVIVRFELESALFEGSLAIDDMEAAWNEKYTEVLGITPSSPSVGYMQDVHWSCGLFGYFPTYSLGNLYSAQLFDAVKKQIGGLDDQVTRGEFGELREWLRLHIHQYGRLFTPAELIEKATGEPLSAGYFNSYVTQKYSDIYGL